MRLRRAACGVITLAVVAATVMWPSEAHAFSHGYVTGLSVSNITTSSAELAITRNNPDGHNYTSNYRYKRSGGSNYTSGSVQSTAATVSVTISGLSSGTNYTVQAAKFPVWLGSVESVSFTTLSGASLSSIAVSGVTGVSATVSATLTNPDTLPVPVYLRYKHTSESAWTTSSGSATSTTADFALAGWTTGETTRSR